ncbi:MAG: hypothetical protein Kow0062_20880 [Acidobacteriota bacterium]
MPPKSEMRGVLHEFSRSRQESQQKNERKGVPAESHLGATVSSAPPVVNEELQAARAPRPRSGR